MGRKSAAGFVRARLMNGHLHDLGHGLGALPEIPGLQQQLLFGSREGTDHGQRGDQVFVLGLADGLPVAADTLG